MTTIKPTETCVEVSRDFSAFVTRHSDCAIVTVYRRTNGQTDFNRIASSYETLGNGATRSARREIARLAAQVQA